MPIFIAPIAKGVENFCRDASCDKGTCIATGGAFPSLEEALFNEGMVPSTGPVEPLNQCDAGTPFQLT